MKKLSEAQQELLRLLSEDFRTAITNESVVKSLQRRGFAERYVQTFGTMTSRHAWRITDQGRMYLKAEQL